MKSERPTFPNKDNDPRSDHRGRHRRLVPTVRRTDLLRRLVGGGAEDGGVDGRRDRRPGRTIAPACGRPPAGPPRASCVRRRAATHVFPMSVPVPTTATTLRGRMPVSVAAGVADGRGQDSASACNNRLTLSSLCAADSVTRRRLVPTGTVGGRMAGTHSPSSSSAAEADERGLLAAEHHRDDRARMSGRCEAGLGHPVDQGGEAARQGGPFGGAQDAERGERRRGVGRRRRGGEDVRAGPVDDEVDHVPGRRHETAQRAQRLGERADPHDHPARGPDRRREVGAEDGVGLIEDEQGVVAPAEVDELVEGGDVPIHGEDGVGDDDGGHGATARPTAAPPGGPCRGGGRRRGLSGRAGTRR